MTAPFYPKYVSQPNQGRLPSMCEMGPPDLRPSSGTSVRYQRKIDLAHGRFLAGLGSTKMNDGEPAYAFNELAVMAEMDDIQGNGVFDPPGAQKNVHPGAGVFAANYSLPGMHARERPFGFSEERDITTGRPIRAVPSGAVANDSSAQIAFIEQGLYPRPQPMVGLAKQHTPFAETWNTMQNPAPIGAADGELVAQRKAMSTAGMALLGIGALLLLNEARKAKVL